jgi:hypothetical protein
MCEKREGGLPIAGLSEVRTETFECDVKPYALRVECVRAERGYPPVTVSPQVCAIREHGTARVDYDLVERDGVRGVRYYSIELVGDPVRIQVTVRHGAETYASTTPWLMSASGKAQPRDPVP